MIIKLPNLFYIECLLWRHESNRFMNNLANLKYTAQWDIESDLMIN